MFWLIKLCRTQKKRKKLLSNLLYVVSDSVLYCVAMSRLASHCYALFSFLRRSQRVVCVLCCCAVCSMSVFVTYDMCDMSADDSMYDYVLNCL